MTERADDPGSGLGEFHPFLDGGVVLTGQDDGQVALVSEVDVSRARDDVVGGVEHLDGQDGQGSDVVVLSYGQW